MSDVQPAVLTMGGLVVKVDGREDLMIEPTGEVWCRGRRVVIDYELATVLTHVLLHVERTRLHPVVPQ